MYFSVNPSSLNSKIEESMPFLSQACPTIEIKADSINNTITISGFNSLAHISNTLEAKVSASGVAIVNGELLSKLLKTYQISQIFIRLDISQTKIMICHKSLFPANESVSIAIIKGTIAIPNTIGSSKVIEVDHKEFVDATSSIKALKSSIPVGNICKNAVKLRIDKERIDLSMFSARGIVISSIESKLLSGNPTGDMIVPIEVVSNLPETDDKMLKIEDCGSFVMFSTSMWTILSSTLQGSIPEYSNILSSTSTGSLTVQAKDILPILKRASLLMDNAGGGVKQVSFNVNYDQLEISINSTKGEYSDHISCCQIGLSGMIGFMVDDLISSMTSIAADSITLSWIAGVVSAIADSKSKKQGIETNCIIKPIVIAAPQTNSKGDNEDVTKQDSNSTKDSTDSTTITDSTKSGSTAPAGSTNTSVGSTVGKLRPIVTGKLFPDARTQQEKEERIEEIEEAFRDARAEAISS